MLGLLIIFRVRFSDEVSYKLVTFFGLGLELGLTFNF